MENSSVETLEGSLIDGENCKMAYEIFHLAIFVIVADKSY